MLIFYSAEKAEFTPGTLSSWSEEIFFFVNYAFNATTSKSLVNTASIPTEITQLIKKVN